MQLRIYNPPIVYGAILLVSLALFYLSCPKMPLLDVTLTRENGENIPRSGVKGKTGWKV